MMVKTKAFVVDVSRRDLLRYLAKRHPSVRVQKRPMLKESINRSSKPRFSERRRPRQSSW